MTSNPTLSSILRVVNDARYVKVDEDQGLFAVWYGGATIGLHSMETALLVDTRTNYDLTLDNIEGRCEEFLRETSE